MRSFDTDLRDHFIGWQCRIRQQSARDYGGQPLAAMRPRVSRKNGDVLLTAMNTLLIPNDSTESTAYFRFQLQKTADPAAARDGGVKYLAGGYFQLPNLFSDRLTAVFGATSGAVVAISRCKEVVLDYEQYAQSFRMFCKVKKLTMTDPDRDASLWQARLFNPAIANDAVVLGFSPDWRSAAAVPAPV